MTETENRLAQLEGQMNAMAQCWLHLLSALEAQQVLDTAPIEQALRHQRWPGNPKVNEGGREALRWMCDQLDIARQNRQKLWHAD